MSTANRPPSVYVDDVFEEVLALPEDERDAAISLRCAGHPSMEHEVRALLKAEASAPQSTAIAIQAGARIGRYTLDTCLGKGASASVWKAWDTHLRTWTALKLLRHDLKQREDALKTVLHEARAASAIISDHVVRIKSAGKIPTGPYYVEMQLCAEHSAESDGEDSLVIGRTLAEERPTRIRESARLVMEAAKGVEAAHRVGVLHRDIKPANILLMPISRRALVADFGLSAAQLYPAPGPGTPSTATITIHLHDGRGLLVGTPAFMPPEQAWGEAPTRANDVYGLGATLYAMIARRAPYQPAGERPLPALDVVRMVREGPPRPLAWTAPGVPPQLVRIVDKAMARDPADRYATAGALAADLQLFLANRPSSVDGRRPWLNVGLFVRRHAALVGAAATLVLMLEASAASLYLLEMRRVELQGEVAVAEQRLSEAVADATKAEAVRQEAVSERDLALSERDQAAEDRAVALLARARAEEGLTAAEKRTAAEIEARMTAEADRLEALKLKLLAEEELARQQHLRASLEGELAAALEARAKAAAQLGSLRDQLAAEMDENKQLEGDMRALTTELLDHRARVAMLETELDLLEAGGLEAHSAHQQATEAAPWMSDTPADPSGDAPLPAGP